MACAEDLGNYDYHDLLEPEITGLDENISVLTHSRLQLTPDLGENEFTDENYAFEWKAIAKNVTEEVTVLADTRALDYEVKLFPGSYNLYFRVTERRTGIFWQVMSHLLVSEATSEGWMVLCKEGDNNRVRLDMISKVTDQTITDVLKDTGMPEMHNPYRISWLTGNLVDPESPFYLTTAEGATRLGRNGFQWKEEYKLDYEMGTHMEQAPAPQVINSFTNGKMFADNGNVYFSDCLVFTGLFGEIGESMPAAPVMGVNLVNDMIMVPMAIIYNTEEKEFYGYAPGLRDAVLGNSKPLHKMNDMVQLLKSLSNGGEITGDAFEEFPKGRDYVWMENTTYDPNKTGTGITYAVLKQGAKYEVYGIQTGELLGGLQFGGPAFAIGKAYYGDLSACQDIDKATQFAFSSLNAYMYYAVGGTVYRVDLQQEGQLKAQRQFSLPMGEVVKVLKFNIFKDRELYLQDYNLVVGSTLGENNGKLRIYEGFKSGGDFSKVKAVVYTGLGNIVDVCYREMLD